MKTADLVDAYDAKVQFCNLPFLKFGQKQHFTGQVRTVKCFEDNVLLKTELQKPGNGNVLIVDGGASTRCALVGDMIASILLDNDWAGIIINGSIRDSAEIDQMNIGLRCLAVSPKKSQKEATGKVDIPVNFGGVWFAKGDWVYCDADGVLISKDKLL